MLNKHQIPTILRAYSNAGVAAAVIDKYAAYSRRAVEMRTAAQRADQLVAVDKSDELIVSLREGDTTPAQAAAALAKQRTADLDELRALLHHASTSADSFATNVVAHSGPAVLAEVEPELAAIVEQAANMRHLGDLADRALLLLEAIHAVESYKLGKRTPATDPETEQRLFAAGREQRATANRAAVAAEYGRKADARQAELERSRAGRRGRIAADMQHRADRAFTITEQREASKRAARPF